MSKPFTNPFFEADLSKLFNVPKFTGEFPLPHFSPEAFLTIQRKNVEAYTALNQAIIESFQSLWRRQAEVIRQTTEELTQSATSIISATPEEKIARQTEASKAALQKCVTNVRDIAETIAKVNTQTLETVSTRINEGLDELRCIVKSGSHAA